MEIIPVDHSRKGGPTQSLVCKRDRKIITGQDKVSIVLPSEEKYATPTPPVCSCQVHQPPKKYRYIQPARPRDFAPRNVYRKPEQPFETASIYRKSYLPVDGDRPDLILPTHNIGMSHAQFATDTIQKMSFPGWCNVAPPEKILPCNHDLQGKGPIQDMTTQKHDYVPKPLIKTEYIYPTNNISLSNEPMSDYTTQKLSYLPVEGCRRDLILPSSMLEWPKGPMEGHTIQKMSYQPCKIPQKPYMPWAQKGKYVTPDQKMATDTIYRKSYIPNDCPERVEPYIPEPQKNLLGADTKFQGNTIYHMSYLNNEGNYKPDLILPTNNIHLSNQKIEGNTIQKMSFQPNPCFQPPSAILPCNHDLLGKGPMQDMTTQKHDYIPKQIDRVYEIRPRPEITLSDQPLSDLTINRLSYLPCNGLEQVQKIMPTNNIMTLTGKMETNTIQKLSYQPVEPATKMYMPWAEKRPYRPPTTKFAEDTIYRMSFDPPGDFIDDGSCDIQPPVCTCTAVC